MTIIIHLPNGIDIWPQIWVYDRLTELVGDLFPEDTELRKTMEEKQVWGRVIPKRLDR